MTDEIALHPAQVASVGGAIAGKAGKVSTLGATIDTATQQLMGELNGAPLGVFSSALDVLHRRIQISLVCAEDNLKALGHGLQMASSEFTNLDASIAALISNLENATPEFVGYEPPGITVHKKGHSWWKKGLLIGGGVLSLVGGGLLALGGAAGEVPSGGLDTPVTVGGGALAASGVADLAEVGADDLLFTAVGEGGASATAGTLEGALDDIVARESANLDQELKDFFNNPANVPDFAGAR